MHTSEKALRAGQILMGTVLAQVGLYAMLRQEFHQGKLLEALRMSALTVAVEDALHLPPALALLAYTKKI
jgi:hypothetical protein